MAKLALVFLAVFLVFQFTSGSPRVRRDEPTTEKNLLAELEASLNKALGAAKENLNTLATNVQSSDIFKNASATLQELGDKIVTQSKKLIDDIQSSASTASNAPAA